MSQYAALPVPAIAAPTPQADEPKQIDQSRLQRYLDGTLQNSGYKAEIENERNGGMIVRFVDASTGQVLIQFPPQAVLDMVAAIEIKEGLSPSMDAQSADFTPASGAIIDKRA